METTYTLAYDDYRHYNKFVLQRLPALRRQRLVRLVLLPAIVLADAWLLHLSWPWLLAALAFCALWVAYASWIPGRVLKKQLEARPDTLGLHTMRLSAQGLADQNPVSLTTVRWDKIMDIAASAQTVVFFVAPRYAFFVPTRAFADPAQARVFEETARAYWRASRDGTAPVLPQAASAWPPAPRMSV